MMTRFRTINSRWLFLAALVAISVLASLAHIAAQSTVNTGSDRTLIRRGLTTYDPAGLSSFASAAKRNGLLRDELTWTFGSKPQRGWYLYTLLINRLLDTNAAPDSERFAKTLSKWQQKRDLRADGVLDEETLYKMIAEWQGNRLKDRTPARPDQLLMAPISDFYDPTRAEELRQVEKQTYAAYKAMVRAALKEKSLGLARGAKNELAASEKFLKIVSSFRSREYQEKLRRESPTSGSAGLAVNSPHFTGRALDLYVGGDPVDTKDSNRALQVRTPLYRWLVNNASRFGFVPYCYEPWHWEFVGR
ncbi:MAG: zinc D-Ala-D-Ala carboxypeptidase [Blastocatellia bacterium]|jgi:hypothetical protein|nr:zinc D-Ala-D-Ala carboxypeptidase [Blastocatellia bacterium]